MSLMSWLQPKKAAAAGAAKVRKSFRETTLPLISPRRGRRILRREQLFSVVRESLIRAGILSSSYEFKVLTLDSNGDGFLVLIDLALPAQAMPDEYLLEVERWIQASARKRHSMKVQAVYWRRKTSPDQHGTVLKSAVAAQTQRAAQTNGQALGEAPNRPEPLPTGAVSAFRRSLQTPAIPKHSFRSDEGVGEGQRSVDMPDLERPPESHSDFSALSETQYGKL